MDIEFGAVVEMGKILVGVVTMAVAAYEWFKARRYKEAFEMSEVTLEGLVAAIELLPESEQTKRLKRTIRQVAENLGTEGPKLAKLVKEVESLLKAHGLVGKGEDMAQAARAAQAVEMARKNRKSDKKAAPLGVLLLVPLLAFSVGCGQAHHLTAESVWPGEDPSQVEVVVEWPQGVTADEVQTFDVDGYAVSVAPYILPKD